VVLLLRTLQDAKALAGKVESQALPGITRLQEAMQQLEQRQAATTGQLHADAAAMRGQVAQLRQWFDANQVGSMQMTCDTVGLLGCRAAMQSWTLTVVHTMYCC
jgi:hypothetical protein